MRIRLNNLLYNKEAVLASLQDYQEVCEGRLLDEGLCVELLPKEKIDNLKEEFCNYVLGIMKNRRQV